MIRKALIVLLPYSLAACGGAKTEGGETSTATETTSEAASETVALSGEAIYKQCIACHTIDKGGRNGVGPNLHGVVGRAVASAEGYTYSAALKAKGGNWDAAALDAYIENPRGWAPGTKMAFAGINDAANRKALIDYLTQQK
jgi:cytochrome c